RGFIYVSGLPRLMISPSPQKDRLLECGSIGVLSFKCITALLHYSSLPLLPAAAEGAVELYHGIELPSPRAGQCQLLIEQLLVGDENLQIVRQPGVIAQTREIGSVLQGADTHF